MRNRSNRTGSTIITSISVSKEFNDIIKHNRFSPTEIFRKGLIMEASENGVDIPFINMKSPVIQERLNAYHDIEKIIKIDAFEQELLNIEIEVAKFREKLIKIKKVIGDI